MKKIILVLLCGIGFLKATGPSYAEIILTPIATHKNGEVLFQTYQDINGMGAHHNGNVKIGWLVVSAAGVWDEHIALKGYAGDDFKEWDRVDALIAKYREKKFNLKNPDKVLKALMKKYGFTKDTPLMVDRDTNFEIRSHGICYAGVCEKRRIKQKTLQGYVSEKMFQKTNGHKLNYENEIMREPFVYKGVFLVHNRHHFDSGIQNYGAFFNIKNKHYQQAVEFDEMFDEIEIDGIVLFQRAKEESLKEHNVKNVKLELQKKLTIDGLTFKLTSFRHKRPYVGGPTKATARIVINNNVDEWIDLSVYGREGSSEYTYESLEWNDYHIKLKEFEYDDFIEISIHGSFK